MGFKIGDRVVMQTPTFPGDAPVGICGVIEGEFTSHDQWNVKWDDGKEYTYVNGSQIGRTHKPAKTAINFILQYELDKDPFETFATMQEVEARIQELALRSDLKRDSIKIYEVAKTYDVKLSTTIVKMTVQKQSKVKKVKGKKRA